MEYLINIACFLFGIIIRHYYVLYAPKIRKKRVKEWDSITTFRFNTEFDLPLKGSLNQNQIMECVCKSAIKCSEKKLKTVLIKEGDYRCKFFLGANFVKKIIEEKT